MKLFFRLPFFSACFGLLLIGTNVFSAVVVTKPSASAIIPSHPMTSETWYGTSFSPSNLTPISFLNKMTWYTAYLYYDNSESIISSAKNVAADSSGNLYICWVNGDNELKLSTNKAGLGEWEVENIAGGVSSCKYISVDSVGNIHMISYSSDTGYFGHITVGNIHMIHGYTSTTDYFRNITGVSNSWTRTNLGKVADASYSRFAVDSSGFVHMSYFDGTNDNLKYATNSSGTLVSETIVNTDYCIATRIVLDSSDKAHIVYLDKDTSYSDTYNLKYATNESGTWKTESVDSTSNSDDIAVDSKGYTHIVYVGIDADGNPTPKYATNKSGSWKKRSLVIQLMPWEYAEYDEFSDFSIALDSQENAHVSYFYNPAVGDRDCAIKYATNKDGMFKSYTLTDQYSYYFTKIIVTSSAVSIVHDTYSYTGGDDSPHYRIRYSSTQEITDTCSDFTLTLTDADCDGVDDSVDADQMDSDGDGTVDSADPDYLDSDNDGTVDSQDVFPDDPTENKDSDSDGIGDNAEIDSDNDGTPDVSDAFPEDATETTDTDDDGIGNNADTDDDGDGFLDDVDPNPTTVDADADHDGIPDSTDDDDDGDGIPDSTDADSGEG